MAAKKVKYRVLTFEPGDLGFIIIEVLPFGKDGGVVYDGIESKREADDICLLLNRGVGPAWDEIKPELTELKLRRQRRLKAKKC